MTRSTFAATLASLAALAGTKRSALAATEVDLRSMPLDRLVSCDPIRETRAMEELTGWITDPMAEKHSAIRSAPSPADYWITSSRNLLTAAFLESLHDIRSTRPTLREAAGTIMQWSAYDGRTLRPAARTSVVCVESAKFIADILDDLIERPPGERSAVLTSARSYMWWYGLRDHERPELPALPGFATYAYRKGLLSKTEMKRSIAMYVQTK